MPSPLVTPLRPVVTRVLATLLPLVPVVPVVPLVASALSAQTPAPPTPAGDAAVPVRTDPFCWRGRPLPRCRAFALFELGLYGGLASTKVRLPPPVFPPGAPTLARDAFETQLSWTVGAMRNIDSTTAIGAALVVAAAGEGATVAATGRVRRWTGRLTSVELAAGPGVTDVSLPPSPRTINGTLYYGSLPSGWRPSLVGEARANLADLVALSVRGVVVPRAGNRTHAALHGGASVGSGLAVAGTVGVAAYVALLIAAFAGGFS